MKLHRIQHAILFIIISLLISACSITEELWFENDGSGRMEMNIDASAMIGLIAMMDTTGQGMGEAMDTTIFFDQEVQKEGLDISKIKNAHLLNQVSMEMNMNEEAETMIIQMNVDFDNLDQIPEILAAVQEVKALQDSTESKSPMENATAFLDQGGLGFSFENGLLTRAAQEIDDDELNPMGEEEEMTPEDIEMMESMFGGMSYTTILHHLPGKVKSVSAPNAEIIDKNVVKITYDIMEMIDQPEIPGYQIKFKKGK